MDKDQRKRAIQAYKLAPTEYGVIQIQNRTNHKRFIAAVPNIKNRWTYYQMNLDANRYPGTALQTDWNATGADNFDYSVLWQKDTADVVNMRATLKELREQWTARLAPEYR
ncbi:MAG: GIY-YIG nuclease family protein [Lactobacillus sp.]|jgi:hypothetical protein|nr:GIY-YIG nuclease family protein [Lactobacillus sp.]MCI2032825.1 GIY-YIG nuclease family protein [Lactobacillus sp.]